jgi:tRNA(Ile)-lysidine synthase
LRRRVLRLWLQEHGPGTGLDFDTVLRLDSMVLGGGPAACTVSAGHAVRRRRGRLRLEPAAGEPDGKRFCFPLPVPGELVLPEQGFRVSTTVAPGIVRPRGCRVGRLPARASLRLPRRGTKLYIRSWVSGDRMRPCGFAGTRKLQDIFVDGKLPRAQRLRIPLLAASRRIIWVPGYRIADGWEVCGDSRDCLQVLIEPL